MSKYFGSISMPMKRRPSFTQATPVVPEPMKGSMMSRRIEEAYKQPDMFVSSPAPKAEQLTLLGAE